MLLASLSAKRLCPFCVSLATSAISFCFLVFDPYVCDIGFHPCGYQFRPHQKFERILCRKAGKMELVFLDEAIRKMRLFDPDREILRAAGVTFGDSA